MQALADTWPNLDGFNALGWYDDVDPTKVRLKSLSDVLGVGESLYYIDYITYIDYISHHKIVPLLRLVSLAYLRPPKHMCVTLIGALGMPPRSAI